MTNPMLIGACTLSSDVLDETSIYSQHNKLWFEKIKISCLRIMRLNLTLGR